MKTLIHQLIADTQAAGGVCACVDLAKTIDTTALVAAGVKLDDLLVSQPDTEDQATEIVDTLCRTGAVDLIVVTGQVIVASPPGQTIIVLTDAVAKPEVAS